MAMASHLVMMFNNGKKFTDSKTTEILWKSLGITADGVDNGLTITEDVGKFSFNSKKLGGVAAGSAAGQVLIYDQIGANSGIAGLDSGGKVPVSQLPNSIMQYKAVWNATTNIPALANGVGNDDTAIGDVYKVSVAGSTDFGAGAITFVVGDYAILNDSKVWEKAHSGADAVVSVNGTAGAVVLDTDDISDTAATNKYYTATAARGDLIAASISTGDTTHAPDGASVFTALGGKSDTGHNHSGVYSPVGHDHSGVYDPAGTAAGIIASSITNGDTTHAPSGDVVFDALALKADASSLGSGEFAAFTNKEVGAITVRQFVKMTVAGQVTLLTSTDSVADESFFGCVKSTTAAADALADVYLPEVGARVTGFTGLDVTKLVYAHGTTAGSYTQTRPTTGKVIILGRPVSATEIIFIGRFDFEYA